jgi:hypothetical protein
VGCMANPLQVFQTQTRGLVRACGCCQQRFLSTCWHKPVQ